MKQWIEDRVLERSRRGLRAVVVNPTMCLGPWDLHRRELCLIPQLLCGEIPVVPLHNMNVIDVREVASGLVSALEAKCYGAPMLFSGHNISGELLCRWICEIGGVAPPYCQRRRQLGPTQAYCWETLLSSLGRKTSYQRAGTDADLSARMDAAQSCLARLRNHHSSPVRNPYRFGRLVPERRVLLSVVLIQNSAMNSRNSSIFLSMAGSSRFSSATPILLRIFPV